MPPACSRVSRRASSTRLRSCGPGSCVCARGRQRTVGAVAVVDEFLPRSAKERDRAGGAERLRCFILPGPVSGSARGHAQQSNGSHDRTPLPAAGLLLDVVVRQLVRWISTLLRSTPGLLELRHVDVPTQPTAFEPRRPPNATNRQYPDRNTPDQLTDPATPKETDACPLNCVVDGDRPRVVSVRLDVELGGQVAAARQASPPRH
jgi:hypothetical protein